MIDLQIFIKRNTSLKLHGSCNPPPLFEVATPIKVLILTLWLPHFLEGQNKGLLTLYVLNFSEKHKHIFTLHFIIIIIIMGRMAFVLRRWRPHDEERHAAYYYASRRGLTYCVALSAVLNFDYLGKCSHLCHYSTLIRHRYLKILPQVRPGPTYST